MLISLLLGVIILWLITRSRDVEEVILQVRQANYGWVLLAMLCAITSHFLRALRWNMLIGTMGYRTSPMITFYAVMTGYLANLAIPRMGEVTRCVTLGKATNTPFNALAGTVLAERVFDLFSMLAIVFVAIALQFGFLRSFIYRVFWLPVLARGTEHWLPLTLIFIAALLLLAGTIYFIRKKMKHAKTGGFFYKLKRQYSGFVHGFTTIRTMRGKRWFVLHSFFIWGLYYLTVYLCFFAINGTAHLSPEAAFTLLAMGSLGLLAPVPGGIGTYHFLTIITLTELYRINPEPATSYAYITHATQMVVNILAGTASWVILSFQSKKTMG